MTTLHLCLILRVILYKMAIFYIILCNNMLTLAAPLRRQYHCSVGYSISWSLLCYILHILTNVASVHYMYKEIWHTVIVYILITAKKIKR